MGGSCAGHGAASFHVQIATGESTQAALRRSRRWNAKEERLYWWQLLTSMALDHTNSLREDHALHCGSQLDRGRRRGINDFSQNALPRGLGR